MVAAQRRADLSLVERRGETASWDVYMESMQAIGSVVPWMLVEVSLGSSACHLANATHVVLPMAPTISQKILVCLAGRATTSGMCPFRGTATTIRPTTLGVGACSALPHLISKNPKT